MRQAGVLIAVVVALATVTSLAGAGTTASPPPGGPAPKVLVGTYTTKLTRADRKRLPRPDLSASDPHWTLVIANTGAGSSPRVLGLHPTVSGGPSIPFGVSGKRIYLQCLNADGFPIRGHNTYTWSLKSRTLTFKIVSTPCRSPDDRNQPIVLTAEPWRKTG